MFRHLLKALWKRKSKNLMLSLEILLTFVVVFAIAAIAARYFQLYHMPIGFQFDSVWSVQMKQPNSSNTESDSMLYDKLTRSLQDLPEVEKVSFATYSPYGETSWQSAFYRSDGSRPTVSDAMQASDNFVDTLTIPLQAGRWFSSADEGATEQPIVVNRRFAETMFPKQSALGKLVRVEEVFSTGGQTRRIVGIIEDFRSHGEFAAPANFVISRLSPQSGSSTAETILLKLKPGTKRGFEAKLNERLMRVRNDWTYKISPLSDLRHSKLRKAVTPLIALSVIGLFLLLMVALGLFGVLWQSTSQRTAEIGLRRAMGATAGNIYRQIIIEQLLITSLAMCFGLIFLVQLPVTGIFGRNLDWPLFSVATIISVSTMALVSVLSALYPAWRASQLSPTEALNYE